MRVGSEVYVEHHKGILTEIQEGLWLVDTGKEIKKSTLEPVVHQYPEGFYEYKGTVVYITPYTAWQREGRLVPYYNYVDKSKPPFGGRCLSESEVAGCAPAEDPYLSEDDVDYLLSKHHRETKGIKTKIKELEDELSGIEKKQKEALKWCPHDWIDGDEESRGKDFLGESKQKEWECSICGETRMQYYTTLG